MNSRVGVIIGLVIALAVLTVPFWYPLAAGQPEPAPQWEFPEGAKCVEDDMAARHMGLLDQWRDEVVREGITEKYKSEDGKFYERSLTKTCLLQCHQDTKADSTRTDTEQAQTIRQRFCQQCHDYANVRPSCWDCHLEGSQR